MMDAASFWQIIDRADTPAELQARLAALPPDELIEFERRFTAATDAAYDWGCGARPM